MTARRLTAVPDPDRNRAVAYIRVSSIGPRDVAHFHSPDLQHQAIADLLGRRGLVEVARVEDIDQTGRHFNRDGVQRVLEMARNRQVDVVALYNLSRLGRNTAETLRVIHELRGLGVTVISASENVDDSPEGQFMLTQFLSMAQLYSDQRGAEWARVHAFMAVGGRQVGQPPIGYVQELTDRVTVKGRRVRRGPMLVDPVLGPAVGRAFRDYAAGARVRDIARALGDLRGAAVWPAQVRRMMSNRFYLGFVTYKGTEHQGLHEPLVDAVTWRACQRRRAADAKTSPRRLQAAHALSGLAVCDVCDAKAQLRSSRERDAGRVARLGCPRQSDLRACTGCGSMRVTDVEAYVLDWLRDYLKALKVDTDVQAARRSRLAVAKANAAHLRAELARNRTARRNLAVDRGRRIIAEDVFLDADADLAAAGDRLVEAIAAAEVMEGLAPRKAATAIKKLLGLWPDATSGERNQMVRDVIAEVRLFPAMYWRQPAAERVHVEPL